MTGEALTNQTEDTQVVVDESGFDDGFAGSVVDRTETPEVNAEEQTNVAEETAPPKLAQITEEQFQALMAKADSVDEMKAENQRNLEKVFGHIGGMKQAVERIQGRAGAPIEITQEDFSELRGEFPEIADLTLAAFKKVAAKLTGGAPTPDFKDLISTEVADTKRELIHSRLDEIVDGDWTQEVNTPGFTEWLAKQDAATQQLAQSTSVRDAAAMLRKYVKAKSTPEATTAAPNTTRQRQLAAAVNPKSAGAKPSVTSEEDEFDAGFKNR
jgi:hypothetical protein